MINLERSQLTLIVVILVIAIAAIAHGSKTLIRNIQNVAIVRQVAIDEPLRVYANKEGVYLKGPFCKMSDLQGPRLRWASPHMKLWSSTVCGSYGQKTVPIELNGPMILYFGGWALAQQGNLDAAIKSWRSAGPVDLLFAIQAAAAWKEGHPTMVTQIAELAEAIDSKEKQEKRGMYHALCNIYLNTNDFSAAVTECERAARNWPAPENYLWLGFAYYYDEDYQAAIEYFSSDYDTGENQERALYWRARSFAALKQYSQAVSDLRWIILKNPEYYPAYFALAGILRSEGDACGASYYYFQLLGKNADQEITRRAQEGLDQLDLRQCS